MLKAFIFVIASLTSLICLAQQNPTRLYGTVQIDDNTSMKATEVTMDDWISFIINNDFDTSLFPSDSCIISPYTILFNDLKKGNGFQYLQILKNNGTAKKMFGENRFVINKNFKEWVDAAACYFSVWIPVTGITFTQAMKYCKWKEAIANSYQRIKIHISLPFVDTYRSVITNKDSVNQNGCYQLNCHSSTDDCNVQLKNVRGEGNCLVWADAYVPTNAGLYNLQGNAAEMTSTMGVQWEVLSGTMQTDLTMTRDKVIPAQATG